MIHGIADCINIYELYFVCIILGVTALFNLIGIICVSVIISILINIVCFKRKYYNKWTLCILI